MPLKDDGQIKVSGVLRRCRVNLSRYVTFNSNNGSVRVLDRIKVKITVKGTTRSIVDTTNCIAASISRGNMCGTLGRFGVV